MIHILIFRINMFSFASIFDILKCMRKQVHVFASFYLIYFGWLMSIIFLSPNTQFLNYFTAIVALFYISFMREELDIILFPAGLIAPFLIIFLSTQNPDIAYFMKVQFQPWIHLAWGTTVVAAHKLSSLAIRGKVYAIS